MSHEFDEVSNFEIDSETEAALRRQDEALLLLERLRSEEPFGFSNAKKIPGQERRDFRRWAMPPGITIEMHDGTRWCKINCSDVGVGGARTDFLPSWADGPTPVRLKGAAGAVIVLSDIMWHGTSANQAGIRFEFLDDEERDFWSGTLIDALLARHSLA
ncbi:MAG: PilZ domain-containing protein [Cytophagales bacterium]|nr:PilZ domain-containing protein [Armatimonadota bacterium]